MDRRVKERLIGASILVALAVLIVPELLSGPKPAVTVPIPASAPEPIRNVTVDLATSKAPLASEADSGASPVATVTASANAAAAGASTAPAAATPSAANSTAAAPAATTSSATMPPLTSPVETVGPAPKSSHAAWAVQLGSFASRANADNLSRKLKEQGFSVYVLPGGSASSQRYRVRVGPLGDRDSAARMAGKLKSIGHDSSLVPPGG